MMEPLELGLYLKLPACNGLVFGGHYISSDVKSIKSEFEAQVTAALMIQSNALIPIKLAVKLCGISRQEINRRIY
ncbi:MAG: hypothetical protein AAB403_14580, partial [Planctomycetota bacterium]